MEAVEQVPEQRVVSSANEMPSQMSIGAWILTFVLLMIPLVNIVMMIVWALDRNSQRRNFAIAYIIITVIMIVLSIILTIIMIAIGASLFQDWSFV